MAKPPDINPIHLDLKQKKNARLIFTKSEIESSDHRALNKDYKMSRAHLTYETV